MIDTHAHLDALEDADEAIARAREAGVTRIVTVGTGIESSRRALELTAHEGVVAALGIDPHQAATGEAARLDELEELLARPGVVAVGEAGLDYHYGADAKTEQQGLFAAQLALADAAGLPIVVHTRAANEDTLALLADHPGTVVMHCFSEPGLVEAALEHGWYVSFAGNVTYPRADDLRAAAALIPVDRILAETDSPYLAPQPVRGRRNEPAFVGHTVAALAAIRDEDASRLADRIDANATAAFRLS
ncbi:MAG: TatD family hydrolase [Gaiellaceae bacterium]